MQRQYPLVRLAASDNGIAAVELVLVVPLLLVLLFGIVDLGRLMFEFHAVSKSLRDATRYLARVPVRCEAGGTAPLHLRIVNAADRTRAINLALTGKVADPVVSSDYLLPYWVDPASIDATVNCISNAAREYKGVYAARDYVPSITMTANVSFPLFGGMLALPFTTMTFAVRHNEVHVGD